MSNTTISTEERELFEAWAISQGFDVSRGKLGLYMSLGINQQFSGWLARAALSTQQASKPVGYMTPYKFTESEKIEYAFDQASDGKEYHLDRLKSCDLFWIGETVEIYDHPEPQAKQTESRDAVNEALEKAAHIAENVMDSYENHKGDNIQTEIYESADGIREGILALKEIKP